MKIGGKAQMMIIKYGAVMVSTGVIWQLSAARFEQDLQKRFTNLIGDNSLDGLVIDWHLAEYDYSAVTVPVDDYQPTYVYA